MGDSDAFTAPGSSQQQFQHTYNLWESSAYYNINDLSARNLVVKDTDDPSCTCSKIEEKELERDSKNRRIISKESLYGYSKSNAKIAENITESNIDDTQSEESKSWTSHYWKKSSPHNEKVQQQTIPKHNVKPTKLQIKLSKALSQPVKIDKAASMMAKMGWAGGALGKSGTGIVEPIAPNTDYALSTTGFGKPEPKPKPPPKVVKQKPKRNVNFRKNVLLLILDFVKNDYELELMFESKLQNAERKKIHNIVEKIANEEQVDNIEENSIMKEIFKYNKSYILRTISEGEMPDRSLCLFKEAPDHMYLVTHLDLRYDPEDTEEAGEMDIDYSKDIDVIAVTDNSINEDIPNTNNVSEINEVECIEIDDDDDDETNEIINIDVNDTEVANSSLNEELEGDKNVTKSNNYAECNTEDCKRKNNIKSERKHLKRGRKRAPKVRIIPRPRKITKRTNKFCKVTENTLKQETNPFMKSILSVQSDDNKVLTKTDLRNQIIEYFDEFIRHDLYREFKFLGAFEGIEVEAINEFINDLWVCCTNGDYLDDQIVSVLREAKCSVAITTDPNGSALIFKTQKEESGT